MGRMRAGAGSVDHRCTRPSIAPWPRDDERVHHRRRFSFSLCFLLHRLHEQMSRVSPFAFLFFCKTLVRAISGASPVWPMFIIFSLYFSISLCSPHQPYLQSFIPPSSPLFSLSFFNVVNLHTPIMIINLLIDCQPKAPIKKKIQKRRLSWRVRPDFFFFF
ncbi:hypothetical protein BC940DRAFT_367645, partial [Gongronella butleri]